MFFCYRPLNSYGFIIETNGCFCLWGIRIVYSRVQRERFSDPMEYERVKNVYVLRNSMLERTKPNMRILHPLPRVGEIDPDVDRNPKAYYFQQTENGVYTRMAIISYLLGVAE